jgi:hypothetical protein
MAAKKRNARLDHPLPQYRKDAKYPGHQLIEALPDIPTTEEAYRALLQLSPDRPSGFREFPTHRKLDLHGDLKLLFLPTAEHVSALQKGVRAVRDGLAYRNLSDPRVHAALYRSAEGRRIGLGRLNPSGGGCLGLLLQGVTGAGKTSFIDRLYAYLTRDGTQCVIWHQEIEGKRCLWPQIPCLRIQCQTTVKGTVAALASQIDGLLGTDHRSRFRGRMPTESFITDLCQILTIQFVGLLIVEDVQKLRAREKDVLEYFCDLMEESGIPVLLVSTYKFRRILARDPTLLSKLTAGGEFDFGLMFYDPKWEAEPDPDDDDWTPFVKGLWDLNTFDQPTPMPAWLPRVVHFHTQGIRRITREMLGALFDRCAYATEVKLTEALIDDIAAVELAKYQEGLTALRRLRIQGAPISDAEAELVEHYLLPTEAVKELQEQVKARKAEQRRARGAKSKPGATKSSPARKRDTAPRSRAKNGTASDAHRRHTARNGGSAGVSAEVIHADLKQRGKIAYPGT